MPERAAPPLSESTVWIVGASEGLGRALAQALDGEGARLILSARSADRLEELAGTLGRARALPMDVTDPASVADGVAAAGEVDLLVYSVGNYEPMTARDWDPEAVERMVETNLLGAVRLLGRALPGFLSRDSGRIVLIGSLSGFRGLPGAVGYGLSKAGLMHLAENLRADLRGTGVRVQLANPGFIDTRLTRKNDFHMPQLMTPEAAAAEVMTLLRSPRFSRSFPAPFAWLFRVLPLLPISLAQAIFKGKG